MASGGAFGGARGYQPRAPEKGVFPLDHFGECKSVQEDYMRCLAENANQAEACRALARQYLECRMQKQLMAPQDLKDLGFSDKPPNTSTEPPKQPQPGQGSGVNEQQGQREKEKLGFIAGTSHFEHRKKS